MPYGGDVTWVAIFFPSGSMLYLFQFAFASCTCHKCKTLSDDFTDALFSGHCLYCIATPLNLNASRHIAILIHAWDGSTGTDLAFGGIIVQ